ncbi:MAG: hypothetical protein A2Y57_00115 [Candidatus Woykebacteria bacterium RBG_13_40_7b]|uniref:Uncharacterized protein n=1 Tax=Candidatus Woykebacteria bacterium RBG_13_40_7b TaxID=1802594 RepID=A0A1G1W6Z6_9BACT|nr:MAG: hypothetical protein A2Y57_00115 [Candidatus Woykebacteria bacterium RBG_13_40_7b]
MKRERKALKREDYLVASFEAIGYSMAIGLALVLYGILLVLLLVETLTQADEPDVPVEEAK